MEENNSDFVDSTVPKNEENEYFKRVCEFFSPVRQRWSLVQEVLLWQKLEISIICFNVINVLFWVFITPRLQIAVGLAILASLLWSIPPLRVWVLSTDLKITSKKLSAKNEKGTNNDNEDSCTEPAAERESETSTKTKIVSYEDLCNAIAVVWKFVAKYYLRLVKIKEENIYKFCGLLVLIIVVVAIFYQRFPVANILYLTVMFLFLWPSIVFYGIKDKITRKLLQLFKPFLTQWQHSQTKRKRGIALKDHREDSDLSDDDDDNFSLNSNKETEEILSGALPVNRRHETSYLGHSDYTESSVISTEGLEFPSLRRESVESYNSDDFIEGLNFGSLNVDAGSHHSSIDFLVGDTSEQQNPEYEHIQRTTSEEKAIPESVPLSGVEQEVRRRAREPSPVPPSRNRSSDDLQGFEIVESSEIENDVTRSNDELQPTESSYIASGVGYVGKFLGYS